MDEYPNVIGKEDYENSDNQVDQFELKIKLDKKIYTTARLLVYYEYDGEIIADDIEIDVNKCTPNQVRYFTTIFINVYLFYGIKCFFFLSFK